MRVARDAAVLGLLGAVVACSGTSNKLIQPAPGGPDATDPQDAGPAKDPDDPVNQPPHSLGTITLGEGHTAGTGEAPKPIVAASFVPDARKTRACTRKLDAACEIVDRPECTDEASTSGCAAGAACGFDDDCKPVCKKVAVCSKECEKDESCTLDPSGKATCQKPEPFDAGPLAFSGTTSAITMYPPYRYDGSDTGAPFLAGADLRVQAQGAVNAGFEKFEESFKATTFIQTSPSLNEIGRDKVFGTDVLPVAWKPGTDAILVTLSGPGGVVTCKANDAAGKFDVPRAAIDAALGDRTSAAGAARLSLAVGRQRKETKKGLHAKGQLASGTVQPEGWLDLVTVSTESTSFQGCSGEASVCGTGCADLQKDPDNCGACDARCPGNETCAAGKCANVATACDQCVDTSEGTVCKATFDACNADLNCTSLMACYRACGDDTCAYVCMNSFASGVTKFQTHSNCLSDACSLVCN